MVELNYPVRFAGSGQQLWLHHVASIFPIKNISQAYSQAYSSFHPYSYIEKLQHAFLCAFQTDEPLQA